MDKYVGSFEHISAQLKKFPSSPGVYLFKNGQGEIVYIGKAKNLKNRAMQYVGNYSRDIKTDIIFSVSSTVEYMLAETELEALMLEAQLIQSHQPRCNVLLKSGQPFLYLFVSSGALPELRIVRMQKQKGTYFGPFLEKSSARKVYDFLMRTFRLKLCKKKIENGCLFYHMGLCAGTCRSDFNKEAYIERLELAKNSLRCGHKKFLELLKKSIEQHNVALEFEKSKELYSYYKAFERVFESLEHKPTDIDEISRKDIWILTDDHKQLFIFSERANVLKKKQVFYFPLANEEIAQDVLSEYFESYYRTFVAPAIILTNFDLGMDKHLYANFFKAWHHKAYTVSIDYPKQGHHAALVRLGIVHAQQEQDKQVALPRALKALLKVPTEPYTIDCFDISHKQGLFMVGSCVRFKDGVPDKAMFRHFHIKTLTGQDDYAALREVVSRRYKNKTDLPDVILIDGGKGQLNAVQDLFSDAEFISLAKREETIFSKRFMAGKILDQKSYAGQVLIALRDYAHHFAISFHRLTERNKF